LLPGCTRIDIDDTGDAADGLASRRDLALMAEIIERMKATAGR
jgi:hypothetical protein